MLTVAEAGVEKSLTITGSGVGGGVVGGAAVTGAFVVGTGVWVGVGADVVVGLGEGAVVTQPAKRKTRDKTTNFETISPFAHRLCTKASEKLYIP